jgi:hypothetical protein
MDGFTVPQRSVPQTDITMRLRGGYFLLMKWLMAFPVPHLRPLGHLSGNANCLFYLTLRHHLSVTFPQGTVLLPLLLPVCHSAVRQSCYPPPSRYSEGRQFSSAPRYPCPGSAGVGRRSVALVFGGVLTIRPARPGFRHRGSRRSTSCPADWRPPATRRGEVAAGTSRASHRRPSH